MPSSSGDPVETISEAQATGDVAALYADIRETLGVPVVNLIWRHLAVLPGSLNWCWESLKPLYASGAIAAHAHALRGGLRVPELPGLTTASLHAAGLEDDDVSRITMILRSYERSNAMNMVALSTLLARLDNTPRTVARPATAAGQESVEGTMPNLLALDEMLPHVQTLVVDLNAVGGRSEILASMYRHLAHWPPYLALIHALIRPFEATGRLESVIGGVIADGRERGACLAAELADVEMPARADSARLRTVLMQFIDGPIGKMIAIVPLIHQAMPR